MEHPDRLHDYALVQRLVVIGSDPFALATAAVGRAQAWQMSLVRAEGPEAPPPLDIEYRRDDPAFAIATHDADLDHAALNTALGAQTGYVGVLGARRRLPVRLARFEADGVTART